MEPSQSGALKVLMVSSDRNILAPGSAVQERMKEYGNLVDELHIVLLSDASHNLKETQISRNVWVYPTGAFIKYFRPFAAAKIGKKIVFDKQFIRGRALITAQDPFECGMAALAIKRRWRLPLEVQLHTDPFSPYFTGFLNDRRKKIAEDVLKHTDSLRVVTESLGKKIVSEFPIDPTKVTVLPIFVDPLRIKNGVIAFDLHARYGWHFILLVVARLAPEKNIGLIIEALAEAKKHFPDIGLVIVGSGSEEGKLKSLAKHLDVDKAVAFAGWQENLVSYYKTSNIFVQASRFEGYGLSLVEAGLVGLPIITTKVGIAEELVNGTDALIVEPTVESFARAILELVNNASNREFLKRNMEKTIAGKLMPQEEFMNRIKVNWEKTALGVMV
jgi:glycosyltransferase involved in cell wall biosynthesis